MIEPKFRCGTNKANYELADELNLPIDSSTQDWSYTAGNPNDIEKYISHYNLTPDEDKKFVLMEIIIQATEDQPEKANFQKYWDKIKTLLETDFSTHEYTIFYWSCFDEQNIENCWRISENMRELWKSNIDNIIEK
jgi:hypothetical protein